MANAKPELPFEAFDTASWKALVEKELKGKSYEDYLIWNSLEGFNIEAWQDQLPVHVPQLPILEEAWKITEPVYDADAQKANQVALDALMNGAEAIWFDKGYLGAAAEVASKGIDQSAAPVFINGGDCFDPFRELLKSEADADFDHSFSHALLNGLRFRERGASAIQEVAFLIAQALEFGNAKGFDSPLIFKVGMGPQFLTELAKLRALRWIWAGILKNEHQPVKNPNVIAVNLTNSYALNDEYTNVLRATSSGMSAAMGGAQFVMIEPWDRHQHHEGSFSQRVSRNVQTLLKEEGRVDKNLNPADGSYFIENLTATIATAAWEMVQEIQSAGGFSVYAKSCTLKTAIDKHRSKILDAYKSNERILLGVNKFQPADTKQEVASGADHYALLPDFLALPYELQNSAE